MELRRAILLFAIVLGLAAIVSSIARPPDRPASDDTDTSPAALAPAGDDSTASAQARSPQPSTVRLRVSAKPETIELELGRPATLLVDVETPGQVDIPSLGLTAAAEPLTPATFELLETDVGRHPITVQPAASETLPSKVGTLRIVAASQPRDPSSRLPKRSDRNVGATASGR